MRNRVMLLAALILAPAALSAQVRPPRAGRGAPPTTAPLPPEVPIVAKALAYKRSRWSGEAYSVIQTFQVPGVGGTTTYTSYGAGSRADYRVSDNFSATMAMTGSTLGSPIIAGTFETGTRFHPGSLEQRLRPFLDTRARFVYLSDNLSAPASVGAIVGGFSGQSYAAQRYSRGFGAVGGAGFDYSFTSSFALTSELTAARDRMNMYRLNSPTSIGLTSHYWMTSFRYTIGFRYNPTSLLHLNQNPMQ